MKKIVIFVSLLLFCTFYIKQTVKAASNSDIDGNIQSTYDFGNGQVYICGQTGGVQGVCYVNSAGYQVTCPKGTQDIKQTQYANSYNQNDCAHVAPVVGAGATTACCIPDGSMATFCAVEKNTGYGRIFATSSNKTSINLNPGPNNTYSACGDNAFCYDANGSAHCGCNSSNCKGDNNPPHNTNYCLEPGNSSDSLVLDPGGGYHYCKSNRYCYMANNQAYCVDAPNTPNGKDYCPFPNDPQKNAIAKVGGWYACGNYPCYNTKSGIGTCDVSQADPTELQGINNGSGSIPGGDPTVLPTLACNSFDKNGNCNQIATALGPIDTSAASFINKMFGIILSLAGIAALLLIIFSGFQLSLSQGEPEKVKEARGMLTSAIVGLLFIILSIVILQIIGVDILQLPGFSAK